MAIAQCNCTLKRNFQGYTTQGQTELFGFGSTSISMLEDTYAQNHKELRDYYLALDTGILPISKGIKLNWDDMIRRDVIMGIMSHLALHKQDIEQKYHISFDKYFSLELEQLKFLEKDGLVKLSNHHISITEIGRLLLRNIAVIFDVRTIQQERKFYRAI